MTSKTKLRIKKGCEDKIKFGNVSVPDKVFKNVRVIPRKKPVRKYTYVTGIECPSCLQRIYSEHRHDFHTCDCGDIFVDGGRDYLRYGAYNTSLDLSNVKRVRIRVYDK